VSAAVLAGLERPPRWHHVPEHAATYGPEVSDLFESVGQSLDPEQRLVLDAKFAVDERDHLVATEFGESAPRQNIKTHGGKAASLGDLVLFRVPQALWTAHLRQTAYEVFRNAEGTGLADLFDNYDDLRRLVYEINDSDGGERSIVLLPSAAGEPKPTLAFVARSERGGRGLTGMRVTYDEALFLKPSMTSAMTPVLSARSMTGQVQLRYLGSPGLMSSAVWREIRDRGRAGNAQALAWIEWSAEREPCEDPHCSHVYGRVEGCALDREHLIRQANLAVDRRIDIRFVMRTERQSLTPADFMRERLGWWDDPPAGDGPFDLEAWAELQHPGTKEGRALQVSSAPVIAVEVAKDRSESTIAWAWPVGDKGHGEIVEERPGVSWVPARLGELAERYGCGLVVLDMDTQAKTLLDPIEQDLGLAVLQVKLADRAAACSSFEDAVRDGTVSHNGDPAISTAMEAATWRDLGDGLRVLSRKYSTGSIRSLYAVVLALHGLGQDLAYDVLDSVG
jgi:hypothetical protein